MIKKKYHTLGTEFKLDAVIEGIRGEESVARICGRAISKTHCITNGGIYFLNLLLKFFTIDAVKSGKKTTVVYDT